MILILYRGWRRGRPEAEGAEEAEESPTSGADSDTVGLTRVCFRIRHENDGIDWVPSKA